MKRFDRRLCPCFCDGDERSRTRSKRIAQLARAVADGKIPLRKALATVKRLVCG